MIQLHVPHSLADLMEMPEPDLQLPFAPTLGELLEVLDERVPGIKHRITAPGGTIRQHLNIFAGDRNARVDGGLNLKLKDGEEVWIIRAVSGGSE